MTDTLTWVRSTRCASGTCVEVAKIGDGYLVRDSKNPEREPIRLTDTEWSNFLRGVDAGVYRF
jgi:hypothetical protein